MSVHAGATPRRQRGSIVVQAAIALSLIVIVLIGSELGYLFYLKRAMQSAVDLAALAGAQALAPGDANACSDARTAALANAAHNLPASLPLASGDIKCGRWDPATQPVAPHFGAPPAGVPLNAVWIVMTRTPALLLPKLPGNAPRTIMVQAMAAQRPPQAALTLRTTLATVSTAQSALLNAVFGGLLGGSLNLSAVGWNGLVDGQLQLLGYLDQLAIDLGIGAGQYDSVLNTQASVGTLLQSAITALQIQGDTAQATLDALNALKLAAEVAPAAPLVRIGDLLGVQTGTQAAGLGLDLQLFQFVEGLVQLANSHNGLVASVPVTIPGLINLTTRVQVIEPAQISGVGDPRLAALDPTGPNAIAVRSAQVRTLMSVELPALNAVAGLLNAVTNATAPLLSVLNGLLTLNLGNLLSCAVVCTNQAVTTVSLLPPPLRIDVNLDAGAGNSHVTNYSCARGAASSLTAETTTSIAELRIGKMGTSAADAAAKVFASAAPPTVSPVPLLGIGAQICTKALLVLMSCGPNQPFYGGGLGVQGDIPVGATSAAQVFASPPPLTEPPVFQAISTQNLVNSLGNSLQAASTLVVALPATGSGGGGSAGVLAAIVNVLTTVVSGLGNVLSSVLSPLLDGLLNSVVNDLLGVNLAQTEVGAQLNCTEGAALVY